MTDRPVDRGVDIPRATPANTRALRKRHILVEGDEPVDLFMVLNLTEDDVQLLNTAVWSAHENHDLAPEQVKRMYRLLNLRVYQDIDEFRACAIEPEDPDLS